MEAAKSKDKYLDKFLNILYDFDDRAKKYIIKKLQGSLKKSKQKRDDFDLSEIAGKWEDSRSSEEIIKDIYDSRVSKPDPISLDE